MSNQSVSTHTIVVSGICLAMLLFASEAQPGSRNGLWVKVQGRLDSHGTYKVDKIKERAAGKYYVLEGIVEKENSTNHSYLLAGFEIVPKADAKYTFIDGTPASKQEVRKNVRIKAIGAFDNSRFYAAEIRVFQYSDDDDIEVEGPIHLVRTVDGDQRLFRVGSMMMLIKGFHHDQQTAQTSFLRRLSNFMSLDGKVKLSDNTRAADIPEGDLTTGSKRYAKLQTTFKTTFSEKIQAYSRVEFFWRARSQSALQAPGSAEGFELRVRDLYVRLNDLAGIQGLQFRVGRQRFRDSRTWLMDSRLDALQLIYAKQRLRFAFAVTRHLGSRDLHREQLHYIGSAYFRIGRGLKTTFTLIKENDERVGRDDPLWLAVQTKGRVSRLLEWWAQGARYSSQRGQISRRGYAADAGIVIRPLLRRTGPFVSYHFAYGSADDPQTQTARERFRQPRLQLNYYKYGGKKRLFYYGSLLTPELTNLRFQAVSLGYAFSRKVTIQTTWRTYEQINPSKTIYSNSLGIAPEGINTDIGNDAEVLLHLLPWRAVDFSISTEWFIPGDAFAAGSKSIFGLRSEFVLYF
ncbi:MAG: alginate export family protein [bacterium]